MGTLLVRVVRTGRLSYQKALNLQKSLSDRKHIFSQSDAPQFRNTLIITEHNPVYTIGIRTKGYSDEDEEKMKNLGAEFHRTNRGGLITFHGPGQLVVYPILYLKDFKPSVRWYVHQIEECAIETCRKYNITAGRTKDTGIWIGEKKICAIGVHVSRYITSHGLALNCDTDLSWFKHIVPCGIVGKGVTSLSEELGRKVAIPEVVPVFLEAFRETFKCDLEESVKDVNIKEIC